ncbi:MAG: LPS assembly lipoprotein LptE [Roseicyclus sp.]
MSLSDRRTFLTLLAAAPLAACGFTPVYGPRGSGNALRGRIRIQPPDTRLGFELVSRLEDRIGRATAPTHVLTFDIETDDRNLAITGTEDITRVNINGSVTYRLTESGSDVQIEAGTVSTFTAYSTTGSPVSTTAARRDAEDRLMIALADQIISRLLSDAGTWQ